MSSSENKKQKKAKEEIKEGQQEQSSEAGSAYSEVAHASMEGTTEQDALALAYDAAEPSFTLEDEEEDEEQEDDAK